MAGFKKYTRRMRREHWGEKCEYCDHRWQRAKSNYLTGNGVCLFCHQRLNEYCARGAAWILNRRGTLRVWDKRLMVSQGSRARKAS